MSLGSVEYYKFSLCSNENNKLQFSVLSLAGKETVSRCYRYQLSLFVDDHIVEPTALLGEQGCLQLLHHFGGEPRYVQGYISACSTDSAGSSGQQYIEIVLEPELARLKHTRNSRVFQSLTAVEMVIQVLKENAIPADYVQSRLLQELPRKPFCMQYDESDLAFVTRILQELGIGYFFQHSANQQRMVLYRDQGALPVSEPTRLLAPGSGLVADQEVVFKKQVRYLIPAAAMMTCSYRYSDQTWNLRRPMTAEVGAHKTFLHAEAELPRANLEQWTNARFDQRHAQEQVIDMHTTSRSLKVGDCFKLQSAKRSDAGPAPEDSELSYFIVGLKVRAQQAVAAKQHASRQASDYDCQLRCVPQNVPFVAESGRKPKIHGVQVARVVAHSNTQQQHNASGDIVTDHLGRVRIQFAWQQANAQSASCWVRVCHFSAGNGWGQQYVPRVGEDVLVAFVNGDPDNPIVTGSYYTGLSRLPYPLPEHKYKTVFRGQDHDGRSNEICLDDSPRHSSVRIVNAAGHRIELDQSSRSISLSSADEHKLSLSDDAGNICLDTKGGHRLRLQDSKPKQGAELVLQSGNGHQIQIDDSNACLQVRSAGGHSMIADDKAKTLQLSSASGHRVTLNDNDQLLTIGSAKGLSLTMDDKRETVSLNNAKGDCQFTLDFSGSNITLMTQGNIKLSAPEGLVEISGRQVDIHASEEARTKSDGAIRHDAANQFNVNAATIESTADGEYNMRGQLIKLN